MVNRDFIYTIENWRTKEIEIKKAITEVFSLTFEKVIDIYTANATRILNFHELFFYLLFTIEGWKVYTLPLNKQHSTMRYLISFLFEKFHILPGSLFKGGSPDFLLVKRSQEVNHFKFVEVKATEKKLNKYQLEWTHAFPYDLFIVKPADSDLKSNDILQMNKLIR